MRTLEDFVAIERRTTRRGAEARLRLANVILGLQADEELWMALHEELMEAYRAKHEQTLALQGEMKAAVLGEAAQLAETRKLLLGIAERFQRLELQFKALDPARRVDINAEP